MQLQFTTLIGATPQTIFDTLVDFAGYHGWLRRSASFGSTTKIAPVPVRLGTTYVDAGRVGTRYGTVTEFEPPTHLGFRQPMRAPISGTIDIDVRYTLEPRGAETYVIRDLALDFHMPPLVKMLIPRIVPMFEAENARVLAALKRHLEAEND